MVRAPGAVPEGPGFNPQSGHLFCQPLTVGALMYLATTTRPDIAYTVGYLARFNSNPGLAHWQAVKHLLRYLNGTADYGITYAPDPNSNELFSTFSDADHGGVGCC